MGKCKQKTHKASSKVLNKKKNGTVTKEVTYVYDGETLKEVNVVMTARTKAYAEEIANNQEIMGGGIDTASIEVKGNKVYAKMNETTIAEMKAVPKSMMAQLFTK